MYLSFQAALLRLARTLAALDRSRPIRLSAILRTRARFNTVHFGSPWGVTCLPDNAGRQQWPVFLPAFRPAFV
jgi:hypothetical protein